MFFRRKGWLRKEYDKKLLVLLEEIRPNWHQQKKLLEKCLEPSEDAICQTKLSEAKYIFLLREAKSRQISIKR